MAARRSERRQGTDRRVFVTSRSSSADKLNFSSRTVVAIMVTVIAIVSAQFATTYSLKSDIQEIKSRMDAAKENAAVEADARERVAAAEEKASELQEQSIREQIAIARAEATEAKRRWELEGYNYKTFEARVIALERKSP